MKSDSEDHAEKTCFYITPLGDEDSEVRKKTEAVIEAVIRPIIELKYGMRLTLPHTIAETDSINNQIIEHLLYDDLVIANLTGNNSNVMYELGIRHTAKKHVIIIAEKGTRLPFDITTERTIFYKHLENVGEFKSNLEKAIIDNLSLVEKDINNPVYRVHDNKVLKDYINNNDVAGILKDINSTVRYLRGSDDFKDFTYRNRFAGIVYQAGLKLAFKCKFSKTIGELSEDDVYMIEQFLEGSHDLSYHGLGHRPLSFDKEEGLVGCNVMSDRPLNKGLVNKELQEKDLPYQVKSIVFEGPLGRLEERRAWGGSDIPENF